MKYMKVFFQHKIFNPMFQNFNCSTNSRVRQIIKTLLHDLHVLHGKISICQRNEKLYFPVFVQAQLLTYMKLAGISTGLLMNFNVKYLKDGIKRMVL